ncbi:NAD-dependent epimerase/dehydratase [Dillenia turbinata]|uniref:NAD-dependent epimerase/dehydratase n=1 Tax=Dillenia turbinata TaxID=194707 RepID=A0AAN8YZB3_9MAGN
MEIAEKGAVCVTGGTGFVASWLIKSLLHHGYNVKATIRSDLISSVSSARKLPSSLVSHDLFTRTARSLRLITLQMS